MGEEAEALSDMGSDEEAAFYMKPFEIDAAWRAYQAAKDAKVGSQIFCPTCGYEHTKTTYHKVFCSNRKTCKGKNCKDSFWNFVRS